jgi:hypothetical protein
VYNSPDIDPEKESSLMEVKVGMKLSLISIFSVQLAFQIFTTIYIHAISYFQSNISFSIFSPRGLNNFASDMWLIAILLSLFLIGYSILQKTKDFPLYLIFVFSGILTLFSLIRNVSLVQVVLFSLLSCTVVLLFNYQRVKQLELSNA